MESRHRPGPDGPGSTSPSCGADGTRRPRRRAGLTAPGVVAFPWGQVPRGIRRGLGRPHRGPRSRSTHESLCEEVLAQAALFHPRAAAGGSVGRALLRRPPTLRTRSLPNPPVRRFEWQSSTRHLTAGPALAVSVHPMQLTSRAPARPAYHGCPDRCNPANAELRLASVRPAEAGGDNGPEQRTELPRSTLSGTESTRRGLLDGRNFFRSLCARRVSPCALWWVRVPLLRG